MTLRSSLVVAGLSVKVPDHAISVLGDGHIAESPTASVKGTDKSLITSDVLAFVKVTSSDCGVAVSVHLWSSSLMLPPPPAGISSVPVDEPLESGPLLTCQYHGAIELALITTDTGPPTLNLQPVTVREVTFARVCVDGT